MTPTFSRRCSLAETNKSVEEEFFLGSQQQSSCQPLSASEQHFLLKSHNALVARITDLERALSRRVSISGYSSSSRPSSVISEATPSEAGSSSSVTGEPNDEMLSFIRDLKSERDELKKDVEGWRTRVNDLDRKHAILAKRVETERWEAWAARSRVGVLEAEKAALVKRVEALDQSLADLESDKSRLEASNRELSAQNEQKAKQVQELEAELKQVREMLEQERALHQQEVAAIRPSAISADPLATPTPQCSSASILLGLGLSDDQPSGVPAFTFTLNPVLEEDDDYHSDEDSGLAGYEDEDEEDDESFDTSSSFGSLDEYPQRSTAHIIDSAANRPVVPPRPDDPLRDSLPSGWTFPRAQSILPKTELHNKQQSVDRFFNCFDESDASDDSAPASPVSFNYEQSKDLFARGFRFAAEDDAPFFFPPGVGTVVDDPTLDMDMKNDRLLSTVAEEEEEDEDEDEEDFDDGDMFGEVGGIRITFTPPDDVEEPEEEVKQIQLASPTKPVSNPPTLPDLKFEEEEEDFLFGLPSSTTVPGPSESVPMASPPPVESCSAVFTPPSSLPRSTSPKIASPSSIPRPVSRQTSHQFKSPPAFNAYATPPTKRGGSVPSFIPQPVTSPSPARTAPQLKSSKPTVAAPKFIRPPIRKSGGGSTATPNSFRKANGSAFTPQPLTSRPLNLNTRWQRETSLAKPRK